MSSLPLAPALDACRQTTPEWEPIYDRFIAGLRASGVAGNAPGVGDRFPDFALPDDRGRYRSLAALLEAGPLVLSFNRGGWCPYCRSELASWGASAPALQEAGARFVSIAAETGGRAARLHDLIGAEATVLCDVDHGLALTVGLAFQCDSELQRRYRACGIDLGEIYGSGSWLLPVPATFLLDRDGIVRFAFADPDFRRRAEPAEVIAIAATL